jgi:thioredoxin 1
MTQQVKDIDFEKEVIKSDLPVLVDFWAEWCGPCRMLGPIIDQVASEHGSKIKVVKLNIDESPEVPSQLGIRSIPTMMVFKNGEVVASKVGVHTKAAIEEWVKPFIL